MNDVAGRAGVGNIFGQVVRDERQRRLTVAGRKTKVDSAIEGLRGGINVIRVTGVLVHLWKRVEGVLQSIDSGKLAVERIEAPVFLVNDDDVLDMLFELRVKRTSGTMLR